MAKSLDQAQMEKKVADNKGKPVPSQDVEIAVRMAIKMLNEGNGLELMKKAINESQDPALVIGQFLAQLMGALGERLAKQIGLNPRVFLAKNGFLDTILDYIEKKLGYPEDFSDQIYTQVLETIKAAAQTPPAPNNVMGEESPAPAPPGAVPPNGGM